ncbi:MAG TPA: DUF2796 domain-containing protein [Methylophaga aminisulfidivorans]|uniref:DUF2796 domain-containing protein n=1 Tax=Methylophaga aminisulfidivorans TaxID=230105 RepID=A0A7C1ZV98_9GAMM|nr:DUF2796 domain-containing protein [Methylophaga aminisulfidivorans]
MKVKKLSGVVLGCCLIFTTAVMAGDLTEHHEAHVHGQANMTLITEGNKVDIAIESPAMNMLGFEHEAHSDQDKKTVTKVEKILSDSSALFTFDSVNCHAETSNVDIGHDEHETMAEETERKHQHMDIDASYSFTCEHIEQLQLVHVALFELFPALSKLNVEWVNNGKQGLDVLTADSPNIRFVTTSSTFNLF